MDNFDVNDICKRALKYSKCEYIWKMRKCPNGVTVMFCDKDGCTYWNKEVYIRARDSKCFFTKSYLSGRMSQEDFDDSRNAETRIEVPKEFVIPKENDIIAHFRDLLMNGKN